MRKAFPLDLSQFRKVSSDKQSTTMQHKDGHQIRVMHKPLSSKLRSALMDMKGSEQHKPDKSKPSGQTYSDVHSEQPIEPKRQKYAKGEEVAANNAPAQAPLDIQPAEDQTAPPAEAAPSSPSSTAPTAESANTTPTISEAQPAPMDSQAEASEPQQPSPQDIYSQEQQKHLQDFAKEDIAWQQDLANQHVTPETYSSLFAKKDTLGKVGTIFGLMIAGGGAGILHQPNAALQIMNQQIQNDLEAQKQSKANAQNFLRIAQQNLMNNAQIEQLKKQGRLIEAQTRAANVDVQAHALAHILTYRSQIQSLQNWTNTLPPGSPSRQGAQQLLNTITGAVNQQNAKVMQDAAHQMATNSANGALQQAAEQPQKEAPKVEEKQKESKEFTPILKESAEDYLNNIKYDPTIPDNQKAELEKEFVDAKQADSVLTAANPLFDKLKQTATPGGWADRHVGQALGAGSEGLAGIPGKVAGEVAGPAITEARKQLGDAFKNTPLGDMLGKAAAKPTEDEFSKERQYETYKNELGDLLRKVYPGIGGSEYNQKLSAIAPDYNDTPDDIQQKRKAFEDLVKTATRTGLWKAKGLTN